MMDCKALLQQMWDYLDDELSADRRAEIEEHIRSCRECFNVAQFDAAFLLRLRSLREPSFITEELRQRLATVMRDKGVSPR